MALFIIRFCLFVPQFTYILRCSPMWLFHNLLTTLDEIIKHTLCAVLNCALSDKAWSQASLPIRFGGLGVRKISSVALPAFLSSSHSTYNLVCKISNTDKFVYLDDAKNAWISISQNTQFPVNLSAQNLWDEPICRSVHEGILASCTDVVDRARFLAISDSESGLWLQALPSTNLGTLLERRTLSIAVGLRLGVKITEPHRCRCGSWVDELGHHGLSCQRSAGRLSRHASINEVIRRALVTVNVPAVLEPNGIARDDGKRPDEMTLVPWQRGRSLVWDATCVDTLAPSHVNATTAVAGAAAATAERNKRRKYASLGEGYIFVPFGVETLGPWGPEARRFYKELTTRLFDATQDPKAGCYFGQKISISIQRGNAASLLGTLPSGIDVAPNI